MKNKGFTLIELLVVILIIGILATIVFLSLTGAISRARDVRRVADLRQLSLALGLYYNKNGKFPGTMHAESWSTLDDALVPEYMAALPVDPLNDTDHQYKYYMSEDKLSYILAVDKLEDIDSPLLNANLKNCGSINNNACYCSDPIYCVGP